MRLGSSESLQEALGLLSMGRRCLEAEAKSASIKSIANSIQMSVACCFPISANALLVSGLCRQLSIDKNDRKRHSTEPVAILFLEGMEDPVDFDSAIGREDVMRAAERRPEHHPRNTALQRSSAVCLYQMRQEVVTSWAMSPTLIRGECLAQIDVVDDLPAGLEAIGQFGRRIWAVPVQSRLGGPA